MLTVALVDSVQDSTTVSGALSRALGASRRRVWIAARFDRAASDWSSECRQNPCKTVEDLEELETCSSENGRENAESRLAHTVGVTGSSPVPPTRKFPSGLFIWNTCLSILT